MIRNRRKCNKNLIESRNNLKRNGSQKKEEDRMMIVNLNNPS